MGKKGGAIAAPATEIATAAPDTGGETEAVLREEALTDFRDVLKRKDQEKGYKPPPAETSNGEEDVGKPNGETETPPPEAAAKEEEPKDERLAKSFAVLARKQREHELRMKKERDELEKQRVQMNEQLERLKRFDALSSVEDPEAALNQVGELLNAKDRLNYDTLTKNRLKGMSDRRVDELEGKLSKALETIETFEKKFEERDKASLHERDEAAKREHAASCKDFIARQNSGQIPRFPYIQALGLEHQITQKIIDTYNEIDPDTGEPKGIQLTPLEAANIIERDLRALDERMESARKRTKEGKPSAKVPDSQIAPPAKRAETTSDGPASLGNRNATFAPRPSEQMLSDEESKKRMIRRLREQKALRIRESRS